MTLIKTAHNDHLDQAWIVNNNVLIVSIVIMIP